MRSFITGITGFVGSHLAEALLARGDEVHGLARWRSPLDNLQDAGITDRVTLHFGDLNDCLSMQSILAEANPARVFHLAGQSYVPTSYIAPADTLRTNIVGTCNLLAACIRVNPIPVVHVCSSSEVYGNPEQDELPIRESCPLRPISPYAVSKVGVDRLGFMYYQTHGLPTVITRSFTHGGPRRGKVFFESAFARQVALIEAGLQEPVLRVGNLASVRTYMDARDTVRAYILLTEQGEFGEVYNIGGNVTKTVGEYLDIYLGLSKVAIEVRPDEALYRPADATMQVPCLDKIHDLGWNAEISVEQSFADMLAYWREKVGR